MNAKRMVSTLNGVLMALSAGMLHAAESTPAGSKLTECPMPVLPIKAVKEEMFGDVTLWYQGNAQGRVADVKIIKSSGFRELDKAAILSLARCKLPIPAEGEAPPSGTTEVKFGRMVRVTSSSKPVLIAGSCAPSERFDTYVASTYDRIEAPGASIRFGVTEAGVPVAAASYEHDKVLAADAIKFIESCRFTPAMVNGAAALGTSDGFIRLKPAAG